MRSPARNARAAIAVFALALASAAPASASYDPIGSGTTTISLDRSFTKLLSRNQIKLSGRKGAKVKGSRAIIDGAGGKADPTIKKAEIEAKGELLLKGAAGSVAITDITVVTKPTPLIAKLGGGQLKIAKAASVKLTREGFGNRLTATALKLTAKAATRFDKRLHTDAFAEGQLLGTLRTATQPTTVAVLPTGLATIQFDPTFYAKMKADSTSITPIFPAEHVGPTYTFPIATEGLIAPDGRAGTLRTAGNLEFLRLGFGQIFWNELWLDLAAPSLTSELDLEPTPKFLGKLGRTPILSLGAATPGSDPSARTVTITGVPLSLTPDTATQFNQAFAEGKPEFGVGETLGTVSFTAQGQ